MWEGEKNTHRYCEVNYLPQRVEQVKCEEIWGKQTCHIWQIHALFSHYLFMVFVFTLFLSIFTSLIYLFHPLCGNIWSIPSCFRQCSDNGASVFCRQTHTHRAVRRKQLRDVIRQMRIMGLQFGLGQRECLAAVRQRLAIKAAPFSPPACSAVELVLPVSLPANNNMNKLKHCDSPTLVLG